MNIGLILHLYQPITQDAVVFKKVTQESYIPLLRFLKNKPNFKVSLSIPLSLLQQWDTYKYTDVIQGYKELITSGQVELVGGSAYHALLPKFTAEQVDDQIMLNEYGLGYYFGQHKGFDGDSALLIQDLRGFFPPELGVNETLVPIINDLGYKWILTEDTCIGDYNSRSESYTQIFRYPLTGVKLVSRDTNLSNLISFKRDTNAADITDYLSRAKDKTDELVVAFDGEFFGHHFKDAFALFENILDSNSDLEFMTISELLKQKERDELTQLLNESSWGASKAELSAGNIYPIWEANDTNRKQWELLDMVSDYVERIPVKYENLSGFETLKIWDLEELKNLTTKDSVKSVLQKVLLAQAQHSDQFWWASRYTMSDGRVLFDKGMIIAGLHCIKRAALVTEDEAFLKEVQNKIDLLMESIS